VCALLPCVAAPHYTGSCVGFVLQRRFLTPPHLPPLPQAPNKVLAAQLCGELRAFFPNNAVTYFVSHFDHYRPEAYKVRTDCAPDKWMPVRPISEPPPFSPFVPPLLTAHCPRF
jgi:hypothetical protein